VSSAADGVVAYTDIWLVSGHPHRQFHEFVEALLSAKRLPMEEKRLARVLFCVIPAVVAGV
jgi:hypothetical protein